MSLKKDGLWIKDALIPVFRRRSQQQALPDSKA